MCNQINSLLIVVFFIITLFFISAAHAGTEIKNSPFFMIGDGEITITAPGGAPLKVRFANDDGSLIDAAFDKIDTLFGFPTREKGENISRRTIAMLDYFSDLVAPGKTVMLKSGYRSKSYNDSLRAAGKTAGKTSTHIDGMALDFSLPGVDGKQLWELIRHRDCCGVGNYGGNVVHLDSGRPRFWEKATSKVNSGASDFNRYIYLSTEYDRNTSGAQIRMFFTSISDFGFGIKRKISYVSDKEGRQVITTGRIDAVGGTKNWPGPGPRFVTTATDDCILIKERTDARFIYTTLPDKLDSGENVRIKIDFCQKPFIEMPDAAVSNEIKIE